MPHSTGLIPEAPQGAPVTLTVGTAVNIGVEPVEVPPPSGPAGNRRRPEGPAHTLGEETAGSRPAAGRQSVEAGFPEAGVTL